jgi:hypothetical protein
MQVTSSTSSKLSTLSNLSLHSTRSRGQVEEISTPTPKQEDHAEAAPNPPRPANRDVDRKLSNIGRVQFAFAAALKIANSIESAYLLDPIL